MNDFNYVKNPTKKKVLREYLHLCNSKNTNRCRSITHIPFHNFKLNSVFWNRSLDGPPAIVTISVHVRVSGAGNVVAASVIPKVVGWHLSTMKCRCAVQVGSYMQELKNNMLIFWQYSDYFSLSNSKNYYDSLSRI